MQGGRYHVNSIRITTLGAFYLQHHCGMARVISRGPLSCSGVGHDVDSRLEAELAAQLGPRKLAEDAMFNLHTYVVF